MFLGVLSQLNTRKMTPQRGVGGEARQGAHSKRHKRAMKLWNYVFPFDCLHTN